MVTLDRRGFLKAGLASSAALSLNSRFAFASESLIQAVEFFQGTPTKLGTTVVLNTKTLVQVPKPGSPLPITANHAVISLFIKQGLVMGADYPGYQSLIGTGSLLRRESFAVRMIPPNPVISQTRAPILQIFATANSENPLSAFFNYLLPDMLPVPGSSSFSNWHQLNVNISSTQATQPRWIIDAVDIDVDTYKINIPFSGHWADRNNNILSNQLPPRTFNWPMTATGLKTAAGAPDYYSLYFGLPVGSPASGFAPFEPKASVYLLGLQASLAKVFANFAPPPGVTAASLIDKQAFVKPLVNSIQAKVAATIGATLTQLRKLEATLEQIQPLIDANETSDVAALNQQIATMINQVQASVTIARNQATLAGASASVQTALLGASLSLQAAAKEASIGASSVTIEDYVYGSTSDLATAQSYANQTLTNTLNGTAVSMPPYATNVIANGIQSTPQIMLDGNAGGTTTVISTGTVYTDQNSFGNNQGVVSSNTIQTDSSGTIIDTTSSTPVSVDTSAQTPLGFTVVEPAASDP